jgi:hypothetical protein
MHYSPPELGQLAAGRVTLSNIVLFLLSYNVSVHRLHSSNIFQYSPRGEAPRTILENIALVQPVHTVSMQYKMFAAVPIWVINHLTLCAGAGRQGEGRDPRRQAQLRVRPARQVDVPELRQGGR